MAEQPGLGKALFTLEGSTSFVTVTHCCWEPKNTFINGKIGLAPESNILPSVEELAGGSKYILGKYASYLPGAHREGACCPVGCLPTSVWAPLVTVPWATLQRQWSTKCRTKRQSVADWVRRCPKFWIVSLIQEHLVLCPWPDGNETVSSQALTSNC